MPLAKQVLANSHITVLLAVMVVLQAMLVADAYRPEKNPETVEYEYTAVKLPSSPYASDFSPKSIEVNEVESLMAVISSEGWEIVTSFVETETVFPNFGSRQYVTGLQPNVRTSGLVLILRRPKPTGPTQAVLGQIDPESDLRP